MFTQDEDLMFFRKSRILYINTHIFDIYQMVKEQLTQCEKFFFIKLISVELDCKVKVLKF